MRHSPRHVAYPELPPPDGTAARTVADSVYVAIREKMSAWQFLMKSAAGLAEPYIPLFLFANK
jgi:hypothetical protein